MEMDQLIAAIGASVQKAQQNIEENSIQQFLNYFETTPVKTKPNLDEKVFGGANEAGVESALMPRTCKITMPGQNGEMVIDIPLIALMHHHTLQLEETRIKLNVKTNVQDDKLQVEVDSVANARDQGQQDVQQIELVFKSGVSPEGISRINQEANKFL